MARSRLHFFFLAVRKNHNIISQCWLYLQQHSLCAVEIRLNFLVSQNLAIELIKQFFCPLHNYAIVRVIKSSQDISLLNNDNCKYVADVKLLKHVKKLLP